ncbi:MAG: TonB-dependent receptor, partial [Steroidobacterales bacterium]
MHKSCTRAIGAAVLIGASAGWMASPSADAQSSAESLYDSGSTIAEVIVTASKRETRLLDTPLAISALSQGALDKQGVTEVRDLAGVVPNLQMGSNGDSSTAISMRGVTSTDTTEVAEAAVSVHQDGFYSPRPQGALALMYDVERVEVLRGPQGTLFGMNSPGGVINVIPAQPRFDRTFFGVQGELGNYSSRDLRGLFNWGASETFAVRASFMLAKHDGYNKQVQDFTDLASPDNGIVADGVPDVDQRYNKHVSPADYYNNQDEWAARLIGRWAPNERFELTATVSRFKDNGAGEAPFADCAAGAGSAVACDHPLRFLRINVPGFVNMTIDDYQLKSRLNLGDSAQIEYRYGIEDEQRRERSDTDSGVFAPAEWSSIGEPLTPEAQGTLYYPIADSMTETRSSRYRSYTHELQLKSSGDQRLNYVLGAFYLHEQKRIAYAMDWMETKSFDSESGAMVDGLPYGVFFDQHQRTTDSHAAFGQLDYELNDKLMLTLGARYSWDKKGDHFGYEYGVWSGNVEWYNNLFTPDSVRAHQSADLQWDMGTNAPLGTDANPLTYITDADRKWSQGTYRLGAKYDFSRDRMVYAAIATGYKMGGLYEAADFCNNGCLQILEYGPEHVTNFEVGYKAKLFDGRLQLSTALFLENYRDMQSTGDKVIGIDTNPGSPTEGRPVIAWTTDNLPKTRITGLEVEFDSTPWQNGQLGGYVSWLHTKVVKGTLIDEYACAERDIYGQTPCGPADEQTSIAGNRLPFAPEWSFALHYEHSFNVGGNLQLRPFVLYHWQSKMWLDVQNYDGPHLSQSQKAYGKIDASLRFAPVRGKYFVELFGENLSNENTK